MDIRERVLRARGARPRDAGELAGWCSAFLGMDVPGAVCEGHDGPMDYLAHSFFSDYGGGRGDCVVWANRGGGKTQLAAAATFLDSIFKRGCETRILGGSLEQSRRMYEYMMGFLDGGGCGLGFGAKAGRRRCEFGNGSNVEVLTQSARNVRGRHVQKLRCDEVELFDADVLAAAGFVPQSRGGVSGAMEIFSTMHEPYGLMREVVEKAGASGVRVFKWCLWEVIEKCEGRNCSRCALWCDCGGKAKRGGGYYRIDDAIAAMGRSSRAGWESEMLCLRPSLDNAVFGNFDEAVHVREVGYDAGLPLYRAIDFGFVNPFVCLWVQVDGDGVVRVIGEYARSKATAAVNGEEVKRLGPCGEGQVAGTFCDPAGAGVNDVSGTSAVKELRAMGIVCKWRASARTEGVEMIRRALRDGRGVSKLVISPKCARLIEAMRCYHYPSGRHSEVPLKDGVYDHAIDALRYFFVNWNGGGGKVRAVRY